MNATLSIPCVGGASDEELKEIILMTLKKKPSYHGLSDLLAKDIPISHMTSIGG